MTEDLRGGKWECDGQPQCCHARVGVLQRKMGALKASGGLRIGRSFSFKASLADDTFETGTPSIDCISSRPVDCRIATSPRNVLVFVSIDSETEASFRSIPPISPILPRRVSGSFILPISTDLGNGTSFCFPVLRDLDVSPFRRTSCVVLSRDKLESSEIARSN